MSNADKDCKTCDNFDKSVFCNLSQAHLDEIEDTKTVNHYKPHQIIFYEGNQPYGVYCISAGKVKVYKMDADGHQQIVRLAGPGELVGYRCLLSDDPYTATAETLEETSICFIDKNTLFRLLGANPSIALRLMTILAQDLRHAEDQMANMVHKNVRERLSELFLLFKTKYGEKTKKGIRLNISLTREELAEFIGTTQESVIRLMTEFKQEGIIRVNGREIILCDIPQLVAMANICD